MFCGSQFPVYQADNTIHGWQEIDNPHLGPMMDLALEGLIWSQHIAYLPVGLLFDAICIPSSLELEHTKVPYTGFYEIPHEVCTSAQLLMWKCKPKPLFHRAAWLFCSCEQKFSLVSSSAHILTALWSPVAKKEDSGLDFFNPECSVVPCISFCSLLLVLFQPSKISSLYYSLFSILY